MKHICSLLALACLTVTTGCDRLICSSSARALQHLGDSYYFEIEGCKSPIIYDASDGNATVVHSHVVDLAYDSTFIIVCQHPYGDTTIVDRHEMSLTEWDEAFARSTYRQYWIINKSEQRNWIVDHSDVNRSHYSNVYGPYQRAEFLMRRKELGVPDGLKLRPAIPRDD